jgi:hypothetical protein
MKLKMWVLIITKKRLNFEQKWYLIDIKGNLSAVATLVETSSVQEN